MVEAYDDEAIRLLDDRGPFDGLFTAVQMPGTLDGLAVATHVEV